ncbi:BPSS1780 family membrane protein [Sutterella sp.]|uniref:BPSS1780 family membrane protein n=1 Tax=Sutterella sp. TaxID=1981025 RepID=UPI0026E0062C|nr:BPSS1780 family membrane protein [Sutterella sp.]MDO5531651.1 BPSS1780 family membrane protein [Sutterella sp.]
MTQLLSPSLGITWLKESFQAVRMQPISYPGIVIFSLLVSGMLSSLPLIGTLIASLWMPYGSVLTGFAARDTLAGRVPVYYTLVAIFRDRTSRYPLLMIGLIASVWMELDMMIFNWLGHEQIDKWQITAEGIDVASITANFPWFAFAMAGLFYIPLLMMTVYSPLLVVQQRQKVGKSLFYSFFGVIRGIAPIIVYLAGITLISGAVFVTLDLILSAAGVPGILAFLAPLIVAGLSAVTQAGVWVMFRDIFRGSSPDGDMPHDLTDSGDGSVKLPPV